MTLTVAQELDCHNTMMWEAPNGGYWFPVWFSVQIVEVLDEHRARGHVIEAWWTSAADIEVTLAKCACGTDYLWHGGKGGRCRACDRAANADRQRLRRIAKRAAPPTACAHCGAGMTPQRTTRRYCSTACRVASLRLRRTLPHAETR